MGADVDRILGLTGVTRQQCADPAMRFDAVVENDLWRAAVEVTGEVHLGLRIAKHIKLGALGAYEYLIRNSTTAQEAFEQAARYIEVVDDRARIELLTEGEHAVVRFALNDGQPFQPESIECLFAALVVVIGEELPQTELVEVRFAHARLGDQAAYDRVFECPLVFGAPHGELVLPAAALASNLRQADPGLARVLEAHVKQLLDRRPESDPFLERFRRALATGLPTGAFGLDALAKVLHLSSRTLRRRLDDHGTSYKAMLEALRRELALHYVGEGALPPDEVATRLGFSDPSTFYRAFKRWTSETPAKYRKRHGGG